MERAILLLTAGSGAQKNLDPEHLPRDGGTPRAAALPLILYISFNTVCIWLFVYSHDVPRTHPQFLSTRRPGTLHRWGQSSSQLIQICRISRPIYSGIRKYRSRPLAWAPHVIFPPPQPNSQIITSALCAPSGSNKSLRVSSEPCD